MAWRLHQSVIRGELDNRQPGLTRGRVWLMGRTDPLELRLTGNALGDVAGTLFTFENPAPQPGEPVGLAARQEGVVGDMTAARRFRSTPPPPEEQAGLYVEWFSETNGRVVIEGPRYVVRILERAWTLTPAEEQQQIRDNRQAICDWLDELNSLGDLDGEEDGEDEDGPEWISEGGEDGDDEVLDEFQWEKFMKESDERAHKFSELFERYKDRPDGERLVAREMGWTWLEEMLEAEEKGLAPGIDQAEPDDLPPLEPNPLTEGVDWIRSEHDHIEHPLAQRARRLALRVWRESEAAGLLRDSGPPEARDLVLQVQIASAKLAGALNHLAYDDDPDGGFIVAALKRGLNVLHQALAAAARPAAEALEPESLEAYRRELFDIRQDVLSLMQAYRSRR